jgi:hypothetical protein
MPGLAYAAAVPLAAWTPLVKILTVLPLSAVPVKVGDVMVVMLSVLEQPVSLVAAKSGVDGAAAVLSSVKVTAVPVKLFPDLSVAVAWALYVPSTCDAQTGIVALLVQVAAVLPVVALCVVARLNTLTCQVEPFQ